MLHRVLARSRRPILRPAQAREVEAKKLRSLSRYLDGPYVSNPSFLVFTRVLRRTGREVTREIADRFEMARASGAELTRAVGVERGVTSNAHRFRLALCFRTPLMALAQNEYALFEAVVSLFFLTQFLKSRISAQGVPDRIDFKNSRRSWHWTIEPTDVRRLQQPAQR